MKIIYSAMCFLVFFFVQSTNAGPLVENTISLETHKKEMKKICQNTVNLALEKIRPFLSKYPILQNKNDLVLVMPVADFNAFAETNENQIWIPIMFCIQNWYMIDAYAQLSKDPLLRHHVSSYIEYLNKRQIKAKKSGDYDNEILYSFNAVSGVERQTLTSGEEKSLHYLKESMMIDSMIFILGHEIGHLVLGHRNSDSISAQISRSREEDADNFSINIMKKASISVLPAATIIQRFLNVEAPFKGKSTSTDTHPRPECRFEKIITSSDELEKVMRDSNLRVDFKKFSGYSIYDYRRIMKELHRDCLANP